jgi:hypothetical protein
MNFKTDIKNYACNSVHEKEDAKSEGFVGYWWGIKDKPPCLCRFAL